MVQGEINTAVSPSISNQTANSNVARLYENVNNNNTNSNNTHNTNTVVNMNGSDNGAEKKKKVGNYIISKTIGEGSFAKVKLGYHLITQQMVAVKVINKREVLKRNYLRANLRREACMMQRMQHPHIIQLFEVMETENCYYIVMELIDGIEFVKYLSKKRSLDENETRQYIRQICSAVDHMHRAKVVHRDIKLQNFMLDQNHNLTIIDFGLSNSLDERDFLNTQCGSPAYAAPEIFAHQDYGPEVDIWSIGVNMYAMLAGKLPFKVENRSKNLAKLHACILKGFEVPPFLTPDCQDLLCRLLEPSPNKRIKMSEIFNHPWINYNTFPVEIIPFKPVVDIKEIKPHIVQYLVEKHDYSETDVVDAIVYRKPIALKAVYYLIEKRIKQGLGFPDPDYTPSDVDNLIKTSTNYVNTLLNNNLNHGHNPNSNSNNNNNVNNFSSNNHHVLINTNGSTGLSKQNSQLLPKRVGIQMATRSSSQKNVDFKTIFNNMNLNSTATNVNRYGNLSRESDINNTNNINSNSPSPDFIAAAVSPIKNTNHMNGNASGSSIRTSRQSNYQDVQINRKISTNFSSNLSTINNNNNNNNNSNNLTNNNSNQIVGNGKTNNDIQSRIPSSNGILRNESRTDRYHGTHANNRISPTSDDSYQQVYYQTPPETNGRSSGGLVNTNANGQNQSSVSRTSVGAGIRSLPSSLYRGSPERSLPRSPERQSEISSTTTSNYRPTSRISTNRPSVTELQTTSPDNKTYDTQKYKVINYLAAKRSLTSCDETGFDSRQKNQTPTTTVVKNRQLHMGKAKIDLDTQPNLNVGVSIKNIGTYIKSSINRNTPETLKSFNSLNIKTSSNIKTNPSSNMITDTMRTRQSTNLVHRHSNPTSNYSTHNNNNSTNSNNNAATSVSIAVSNPNATNPKPRTLQSTAASISADSSANALPRIRINS